MSATGQYFRYGLGHFLVSLVKLFILTKLGLRDVGSKQFHVGHYLKMYETYKETRSRRSLAVLDMDMDQEQATVHTAYPGFIEGFLGRHNESTLRSFLVTRNMMVSLKCHDYGQKRPGRKCPYKQIKYFNALRNYGCNCFPKNFDSIYPPTGAVMYVPGSNGAGIDEVDLACQNLYHMYNCFEVDGCSMATGYNYHQAADGTIICGTEANPDYQNDPVAGRCRLAACQIDREFAYAVYPLLGNPWKFRKQRKGNYNAWRNEEICFKTPREGKSDVGPRNIDACCGDYPKRHVYSSDREECCIDGSVQPIGFC